MHVASVRCIEKCFFSNDNHTLKFFTEGFENLPLSVFFSVPQICYRSSIEQSAWLYFYFLFGKFHSNTHNKMVDNNGTALPHETDFDISNDCFCWMDIFIWWFEDYQLPTIAYRSNSFSSSLLHMFQLSRSEWTAPTLLLLPGISDIYEFFMSITLFINSMWKSWQLIMKLGACVAPVHHLHLQILICVNKAVVLALVKAASRTSLKINAIYNF